MSKTRTIIEFDPQDFASTATVLNMVEAAMKMHMAPDAGADVNITVDEDERRAYKGAEANTPAPAPGPLVGTDSPAPDPLVGTDPPAVQETADPQITVPSNLTYDAKDLDSAGVPWCKEIHQSKRGKMADGTFKKKKGLDKTFYDESVEELKRVVATPSSATSAVPDGEQSNPTIGAAPDPPSNPAAAAGAPVHTYEQLFARFQKAVTDGRCVPTKLNELCMAHGLNNATLITTRPDIVDTIWEELDTELGVDL